MPVTKKATATASGGVEKVKTAQPQPSSPKGIREATTKEEEKNISMNTKVKTSAEMARLSPNKASGAKDASVVDNKATPPKEALSKVKEDTSSRKSGDPPANGKIVAEAVKNIESKDKAAKEAEILDKKCEAPSADTVGKASKPDEKASGKAESAKVSQKQKQDEKTKKGMRDASFKWTATPAKKVILMGSFNSWKGELMTQEGNCFKLARRLPPGKHTYKFVVDGNWWYDFRLPNEPDSCGNVNNVLVM